MGSSKHKIFVALTAVSVMSGCSMVRSDYTSWEGHSSRELLESWGQPDVTEELGNDYLAYTWLGDDGVCRRTFMARADKLTGYSETDC